MTRSELIVSHARSMLGTPWRHRGRKEWAVDCIGLVEISLRAAGWTPRGDVPRHYGREPWDDHLRKALCAEFGPPVEKMQAGDIALIRWQHAEPSHVGVLADHPQGGLSIIHASNLIGVVETSLRGRIAESVIEAYRWSET